MIDINIGGRDVSVPAISELSFNDFNKIILRANCCDLEGYLSLYCDIPLSELRQKGLASVDSLRGLHRRIFDLDPAAVLKKGKTVLFYGGEAVSLTDLDYVQFYQGYFYEMVMQRAESGDIGRPEMYLYCLAIALSRPGGPDMDGVEEIYGVLSGMPWKDVLPQGFFLQRKWRLPSTGMRCTSKTFMLGLRAVGLSIRLQSRWLGKRERRLLYRSFATYFAARWEACLRWTLRRPAGT